MSLKIVKALEPVVLGLGAFIIALLVFSLVMMSRISTHIQDVTRSWKAQPIVSIYAMSRYQEKGCSLGYVVLSVNHVALPEISQAACGCAQNPFGYVSTNGTCSQGEHSDYCMSLDSLHRKESSRWRGSTFCIKRAGRPAAAYKGHFAGRPHPNKHGECPKEYKKCGDGRNQDEGAICFPENVECPITSIVVLPRSDPVLVEQGWEPGGTFLNGDYALYFRREHINELPIINITVALSEVIDGHNTRGHCYRGGAQDVQATIQASKTDLWRYTATFPPPCETSDTRYKLADQMSLTDAYLRNLQAIEPACAGFQLLSLNDSRYNKSSDPDYLNSGVKCGTDPCYVCVRDTYQRINCATEDHICNGIVQQNICGQYAHAVRSAFSDSRASLGLFFVREIEWSDHCGVSKEDIFNYRKVPRVIMSQLGWSVVLFLLFSAFMYIKKLGVLPGEIIANEMAQVESAVMYVFVLFPMLGLYFAALVKKLQVNKYTYAFIDIQDTILLCGFQKITSTAFTRLWRVDNAQTN